MPLRSATILRQVPPAVWVLSSSRLFPPAWAGLVTSTRWAFRGVQGCSVGLRCLAARNTRAPRRRYRAARTTGAMVGKPKSAVPPDHFVGPGPMVAERAHPARVAIGRLRLWVSSLRTGAPRPPVRGSSRPIEPRLACHKGGTR